MYKSNNVLFYNSNCKKKDNFQGANNANFSILQHPRAFALNQPYVWPSTVYDVDADSLFFELAPAAGTFTGFPVVYSSGYSYQNPLGTQPGTSCTINPVTGDLMLQSSSSQKCDITYRVSEFNYDSTFNTYVQVNSRLVSKTAVVSSLFSHSVLSPEITIIDTLKTCGDTSLTVRPNFNLFFTSVEPSGTDFMILDPYNHLVPIDYVKPEQFFLDSALLSIHFLPSLEVNGVYKLITMVGSDLNTLYDLCGNAISDYDTLYFKVQGCTSVDIQENTDGRFNVFPNPVQNSFKLTGQGLSQYSIQLVDITGRLMNADMISQSDAVIEFDLSTISAGVYILRISDQKEFYTTKIVKQ